MGDRMEENGALSVIRNGLFYGSADCTKSQPDLFIPHSFKILAPSQVDGFIEKVKESLSEEDEILSFIRFPFCFSGYLFFPVFI